ncbi:MAG: ATP-grasp domain-containing protein [Rubrobacteridae bacterium]|nr:ATP-grasp domain-containing protein [Rubrobacteridae bacterium]
MKILVIGNVGFDLMAPYLKSNDIESVLVITTREPLNAEYADKALMFGSDTEFYPLVELALAERVDGVISIAGPDIANVRDSHVKHILENEFGIPVIANPLNASLTATNKQRTKQFLTNCDVPVTEGRTVYSVSDALDAASELGYPLMLKMLDNSGGTGMKLIENRLELIKSVGITKPVLLEKFEAGPEFSVEVLNFKGKALPLFPVFKGYSNNQCLHPLERVKLAPAPLKESDASRLRELALKTVTALDVQPTGDVDIVWSENGPLVLEVNPRFGGVTALSMAASGIISYHAIIDMLLNKWQTNEYSLNEQYAADMPVYSDIEIDKVNSLLGIDGVFRVKLQKLTKTAGRIALKAHSRTELLEAAKQVSAFCDCTDCYLQLKNIPDRLKVAA